MISNYKILSYFHEITKLIFEAQVDGGVMVKRIT